MAFRVVGQAITLLGAGYGQIMYYWVEFSGFRALIYQVVVAAPNILPLDRSWVLVKLLRQLTRLAMALQLKLILTDTSVNEILHRLVADWNRHK